MEKPGPKSTLAWLQRLVFVLIWILVVYVCLQCFNDKYYFFILFCSVLKENWPREDAQICFPHAGYHMCMFFWHALQIPRELLLEQFGQEMMWLSWFCLASLGRLPWFPSPAQEGAGTPSWFLHPLRLGEQWALNTGFWEMPTFCASWGNPARLCMFHSIKDHSSEITRLGWS